MNFVIYGEEKLLADQKLEGLKKEYDISEENMNCNVYWPTDFVMKDVIEDAMTPPFLSEYKMVILRNPLFLTAQKQKKEVTDEELKMMMDYLVVDNPSTVFVVFLEGKGFDERKKIVKTLRKTAKFFEMNKLTTHQLYKTTRQAIIHRERTIDDDALELLLNRVGDNLFEMSTEVDKLCLYSTHITKDDVEKLVTPRLEEDVFALTNAILKKDMGKAISIYQDLMMNNNEPIALIALIANSLRNLYQVKLLEYKGYNDKEMVKMLSLNPRSIYPIRMNAKQFELNELLEKINQLAELDLKIKTGVVDKKKGLELFLIRL